MKPGFLQTEKNGIGSIERAQTAFGKTASRSTGRFRVEWNTELQRLFSPFFENAEDIAGLTEIEAGKRFEEFKDAAGASFFRRRCVRIV